nr:hypothetical protein [Tanacetum cinerariifolium]
MPLPLNPSWHFGDISLARVYKVGSRENTMKWNNCSNSFGEKAQGCTWNARVAICNAPLRKEDV